MYPTRFRLGLSQAAKLKFNWMIIQGIAHYSDGIKSDSWKRFASLMAASLTAHFLSDTDVFQDWSHY